jgi:hypothetical protein
MLPPITLLRALIMPETMAVYKHRQTNARNNDTIYKDEIIILAFA